MTEAERYLMYIRQITADWNKLVGECGRLEQENRELKEKVLTYGGESDIIEESREVHWTKGDKGLFTGSISVSASGANVLKKKGFVNKQKLMNHWQNGRTHQQEYIKDGITTAEQYEQRAVSLAESATNKNILGHLDKDNHIVRYDKRTNDFVKADIVKGVITMYKPVDGIKYYNQKRKEDIAYGGRA